MPQALSASNQAGDARGYRFLLTTKRGEHQARKEQFMLASEWRRLRLTVSELSSETSLELMYLIKQ